MPLSRRGAGIGLVGALCLGGSLARAAAGDSAGAGRRVRVLSSTDRSAAQPLIDAFERQHDGTRIDYADLGTKALYEQFLADGANTADVLWSSAMDLQIKLVNDGHAARYESPHARHLPRWAVWKHEAYGTTSEPMGLAYHRPSLAAHDVPRTHVALAALLSAQAARFRGRVATYDITRAAWGSSARRTMRWPRRSIGTWCAHSASVAPACTPTARACSRRWPRGRR
jgi:iron(III) transport system substrate-binding protein